MSKNRSRRLRKKLHLGEFQELGFEIAVSFKTPLAPDEMEAFVDAFLAEAIEPCRLSYGGWAESGMVVREGRGSVTPEEREQVLKWLNDRDDVLKAEAGNLTDVWHPVDKIK